MCGSQSKSLFDQILDPSLIEDALQANTAAPFLRDLLEERSGRNLRRSFKINYRNFVESLKKIAQNKIATKDKKRSMSSHVSSRWFRAPEIALVEKQYDSASDLWSLGCCLHELMQMKNGEAKNPGTGYALFPSNHCFPLSPKQEDKSSNEDKDLIVKILETLKPLNEDDLSFISQPDAKVYIQKK